MQTIALCNQKGGVGKTTTALTLTAGLSAKGFRTLFIDLDPQRNATTTLGHAQADSPTSLEVLTQEASIKDALLSTPIGADLVRAGKGLALVDLYLTGADKYIRLKEALKPLSRKYDYCIIDCPPSLGTLTVNGISASNYVIVPAICDLFSGYGITDLAQTIEEVKKSSNKKVKVLGVLLTQYDSRTNLSKEMREVLKIVTNALDTELFESTIRASVKAKELQLKSQGLFAYAPRHGLTKDYENFVSEVIRKTKG